MSLPSKEILDDIKELITEITGFQESDENFSICECYCLSHVVHHTYPFVTRSTVKNLVNSFVSRFYGHGYFKVSQELNYQLKNFLSNDKLFEKSPQYDIQWSLLSLLCSLSSDLVTVKDLPELLPVDDEESETEDTNWSEYLQADLPIQYPEVLSSDSDNFSKDDESESDEFYSGHSIHSQSVTESEKNRKENILIEIASDSQCNSEAASELRQRKVRELLSCKQSLLEIEYDFKLRGNISEKLDKVLSAEGIERQYQLLSEFELMDYILFQFISGRNIFLKKGLTNPALVSLTQETLHSYLEYLQPYFEIINCFKEFDADINELKYSDKYEGDCTGYIKKSEFSFSSSNCNGKKHKMANVLFVYSSVLRKALEPFQNQLVEIAQNLRDYTLIKLEPKLQPYLAELSSLYSVHIRATKNWRDDSNWMSTVRILSVLYNAITDSTSVRMSFVFLNMFLQCFQVYLDKIDLWISDRDLRDPYGEFIITKIEEDFKSESSCSVYAIHPYKEELMNAGISEVPIIHFIGEKMIHVGQSLEILNRLNRFVADENQTTNQSFHSCLTEKISEKIKSFESCTSPPKQTQPKPQEKKKSIFTMKTAMLVFERDERGGRGRGGGDGLFIGNILDEILREEKEEEERKKNYAKNQQQEKQINAADDHRCYKEIVYSTVVNPFFKKAFSELGIKQVEKRLEEAKKRREESEGDGALMVVKQGDEKKRTVYLFHKIISKSFYEIFEARVTKTCSVVNRIFLEECDLPTHLSLLRSVMLFNDAYIIQPFILALFTQPVIWKSSYSFTFHLQECMRSMYKDHASRLSVTINKTDQEVDFSSVLQVIDAITINYEVNWPLTLVLTPQIMKKYNEVFRLALKIKWTHWALSSLHFHRENPCKISKRTLHRIQLVRFWFLSDLNRVANYLMAQMLPWDLDFSSCADFKDIVKVHSDFINKVHENCLLGSKSPDGRDLILKTLIPLCSSLLTDGIAMEEETLRRREEASAVCHRRLSNLLVLLEEK